MSTAHRRALRRCPWAGIADVEYQRYHDEEWGVPITTDRALFEKLVLEGFQAGLSWLTILRKRSNFRSAFAGFAPESVASFGSKDISRLMKNEGIVRNRAKIEATISNAKAYIRLAERTSLSELMWGFLEKGPIQNRYKTMADVPTETELSRHMSKALKGEGFRFVGPTTLYALMQSVGMVNDHLVDCHRHAPCAKLQRGRATL